VGWWETAISSSDLGKKTTKVNLKKKEKKKKGKKEESMKN